MPGEYWDAQGETDISGVPPAERATTAHAAASENARSQNQNERRPQVQQPRQQNPVGGFFSALGSRARGAEDAATNWLAARNSDAMQQSDSPLDWGQEVNQAPAQVWGLLRHGYAALSGGYHDGVHAIFNGDDLKSRLGQQLAFGASAVENPIRGAMALKDIWGDVAGDVRQGELSDPGKFLQHYHQQVAGEEQKAVGDLPGAEANVASLLPVPGTGLARGALLAAGIAAPMVDQIMSSDPDEQHAGLLWLGVGALLSAGHIPGPLRKLLLSRFGDWPVVEQVFQDATQGRQKAAEAAMDPEKMQKALDDHVQRSIDTRPEPASRAGLHRLVASHMPGEPPLRDPSLPLNELSGGARQAGDQHLGHLASLVSQLHSGLWATHENPSEQILRAIVGHARALDATFNGYFNSMSKMLGDVSTERRVQMMQAAEGDMDVYRALRPAERLAVDSWRVLAGTMRETSQGTDYAHNFVANYAPRRDDLPPEAVKRGRPSRAATIARENRKHRAAIEEQDPFSGDVVMGQKYPTVQSANDALRAARQVMVQQLLDPAQQLRQALEDNPEAQEIRRLVDSDFEQARQRAVNLANDHYALKSEDFLSNISRVAPNQARAILTQKGLNELAKTIINATREDGSVVRRAGAVKTAGMDSRDVEEKLAQGYTHINDARFRSYVFDKDVAKILNRYVSLDANLPGYVDAAAKVNRQLLRLVMYSPHIHGLNVARRMGALAFNHPIEFARYVAGHKALLPAQMDDVSQALRTEAYQGGLLPPRAAKGWQSNFSDVVDTALGHKGEQATPFADVTRRSGRLAQALATPLRGYHTYEDGFWKWVNDFGVMAYHVEKNALSGKGVSEANARAWAARRANSWMGMVLPEDTNLAMSKLSRLAVFAPNWWRTMGELMVPAYKRSGIFNDGQMATHAAMSALKTTAAMYGSMKAGTWAMNYMLSGHGQDQNLPGHQDDVEIRNPGVLHALERIGLLPQGIDPETGEDSRTGARMYIRVGGQMEDVLQALGLESGQPGTPVGPKVGPLQLSLPGKPEDTWDGMTRFLAARTSPLVNSSAAAMNLDLYSSVTQGLQPRAVVPGTQPGLPNPLSVLSAAVQALPGGQAFAQQVQRGVDQNTGDSTSLFGTKVPSSLSSYTAALKNAGERAAISGLIGVNPPYESAQRTRGVPPSEGQYNTVHQLTDQYQRQQLQLGAELMSGQRTPYQWRQAYLDQSRQHGAQMRALFHNAPEYVNGSQGLVNQWESLYDRATGADGVLDQAKLGELQAQFRANHTAQQMADMQSELNKAANNNPALALYHKVFDAADQWEQDWASRNGLDVTQLRNENAEYNSLRSDATAQRKYLAQHRELTRLKVAIRREFYRTPQGMMYALYRGDNQAVMRTLKARHLTTADLAQEVEAA